MPLYSLPCFRPWLPHYLPWPTLAESLQSLLTKYGERCPLLWVSSASLLITGTGSDETPSVVSFTTVSTMNDDPTLSQEYLITMHYHVVVKFRPFPSL